MRKSGNLIGVILLVLYLLKESVMTVFSKVLENTYSQVIPIYKY